MRRTKDLLFAVFVASAIFSGSLATQEPPALAPELLGVVYYHDTVKQELVPLERQPALRSTSGGGFFFGQFKRKISVEGGNSPVQLVNTQPLEFVISNGDLQLYRLESKKDHREVVISKTTVYWVTSRSKSQFAERMLDVKRYGSSVKIIPTEPLPAGEYGFSVGTEMFCFAVVPAPPK